MAIKAVSATPLLPGVNGIIIIIHITKERARTIRWSTFPEIASITKLASIYLASHAIAVAAKDFAQNAIDSFFSCFDVRFISMPT